MKKLFTPTNKLIIAFFAISQSVNAMPLHSKFLQSLQQNKIVSNAAMKQSRSLNRCISDSNYYIGSTFALQNVTNYKYNSSYGYFPTRNQIAFTEGIIFLNSVDDYNNSNNSTNNYDTSINLNVSSVNGDRQTNSFNANHLVYSTINESLTSGNWLLSGKTNYTFNANNFVSGMNTFDNNLTAQDKIFFTYDNNNKIIKFLKLNWNTTTSTWDSFNISTITYGANNKIANYINKVYNVNHWDNYEQSIFTYDANNNLTDYLYKVWDGTAWQNSFEEVYHYNTYNQISSVDGWEMTSATPSVWINDQKLNYTYPNTSTNQQTNILETSLNTTSGTFVNSYNNNYTYTYDNQIKMYETLTWDVASSSWKNNQKNVFTYSSYIPTAITDNIKQNDFKLLNTIANNQLQMQTERNQPILIYNQMGSLVLQSSITTGINTIDVSNFSAGLYFIKTQYGNYKFCKID